MNSAVHNKCLLIIYVNFSRPPVQTYGWHCKLFVGNLFRIFTPNTSCSVSPSDVSSDSCDVKLSTVSCLDFRTAVKSFSYSQKTQGYWTTATINGFFNGLAVKLLRITYQVGLLLNSQYSHMRTGILIAYPNTLTVMPEYLTVASIICNQVNVNVHLRIVMKVQNAIVLFSEHRRPSASIRLHGLLRVCQWLVQGCTRQHREPNGPVNCKSSTLNHWVTH